MLTCGTTNVGAAGDGLVDWAAGDGAGGAAQATIIALAQNTARITLLHEARVSIITSLARMSCLSVDFSVAVVGPGHPCILDARDGWPAGELCAREHQ